MSLRASDHLSLKLGIFSGHTASFKISISKVQDFGNFELTPMKLSLIGKYVINNSKMLNIKGDFSDFRIPCKIEGIYSPLILSVFCDVKGLSVTYSVSQDAENTL